MDHPYPLDSLVQFTPTDDRIYKIYAVGITQDADYYYHLVNASGFPYHGGGPADKVKFLGRMRGKRTVKDWLRPPRPKWTFTLDRPVYYID